MELEMIENVDTTVAEISVRLLDDAYLVWFTAESDAQDALRAWFEAVGSEREGAYVAYRAALGREEAAARDLELLWRRAEPRREPIAEDNKASIDEVRDGNRE